MNPYSLPLTNIQTSATEDLSVPDLRKPVVIPRNTSTLPGVIDRAKISSPNSRKWLHPETAIEVISVEGVPDAVNMAMHGCSVVSRHGGMSVIGHAGAKPDIAGVFPRRNVASTLFLEATDTVNTSER